MPVRDILHPPPPMHNNVLLSSGRSAGCSIAELCRAFFKMYLTMLDRIVTVWHNKAARELKEFMGTLI